MPRQVFLRRGLSRFFFFLSGEWVGWYFSVREKHSLKFLQVLQQLDLVSTLAVFYLDMSLLVQIETPDQVFSIYKLQF